MEVDDPKLDTLSIATLNPQGNVRISALTLTKPGFMGQASQPVASLSGSLPGGLQLSLSAVTAQRFSPNRRSGFINVTAPTAPPPPPPLFGASSGGVPFHGTMTSDFGWIAAWDSGASPSFLNRNGRTFVLYLMPPMEFAGSQAGVNTYVNVCTRHGFSPVVTSSVFYHALETCQPHGCMPACGDPSSFGHGDFEHVSARRQRPTTSHNHRAPWPRCSDCPQLCPLLLSRACFAEQRFRRCVGHGLEQHGRFRSGPQRAWYGDWRGHHEHGERGGRQGMDRPEILPRVRAGVPGSNWGVLS
jgi:hypothetical protein